MFKKDQPLNNGFNIDLLNNFLFTLLQLIHILPLSLFPNEGKQLEYVVFDEFEEVSGQFEFLLLLRFLR